MREFNDFEKRILNRMVNHESDQDCIIARLLFEFCDVYCIGWDKKTNSLRIACHPDRDWASVRKDLLDFIVLVQYLEANSYIGLFSSDFTEENLVYNKSKYEIIGEFPNLTIFEKAKRINVHFNTNQIHFDGKDMLFEAKTHIPGIMYEGNIKLGEILKSLFNSIYHPTQTLKEFVKNGFKTKEDIRYKWTQIAAWTAIGVSLFVGMVSLFQNCHSSKVIESQQVEILDSLRQSSVIKANQNNSIMMKQISPNTSSTNRQARSRKDN